MMLSREIRKLSSNAKEGVYYLEGRSLCHCCNKHRRDSHILLCYSCDKISCLKCTGLYTSPSGDWICHQCSEHDDSKKRKRKSSLYNYCKEEESESQKTYPCSSCGKNKLPHKILVCEGLLSNGDECGAEVCYECAGYQRLPKSKWFCQSCSHNLELITPKHKYKKPKPNFWDLSDTVQESLSFGVDMDLKKMIRDSGSRLYFQIENLPERIGNLIKEEINTQDIQISLLPYLTEDDKLVKIINFSKELLESNKYLTMLEEEHKILKKKFSRLPSEIRIQLEGLWGLLSCRVDKLSESEKLSEIISMGYIILECKKSRELVTQYYKQKGASQLKKCYQEFVDSVQLLEES